MHGIRFATNSDLISTEIQSYDAMRCAYCALHGNLTPFSRSIELIT